MSIKTYVASTTLSASDMNTYSANSGLVYVSSKTWTSTSSAQQIDSCFTSTYDNYHLVLSVTTGSGSPTNVYMRFVDGTTPDTGSVYGSNVTTSNGVTGLTNTWTGIVGQLYVGYAADLTGFMTIDLANPQVSGKATAINAFGSGFGNSTQLVSTIYGLTTSTTQYEGIYIYPGGGTWAGTCTVYGYRKG
jgi:hypothetical protein